jgi:hypothetical protein
MAEKATGNVREVPREAGSARIEWDDSNMQSAYANVCNVTSSREEVVLFFGISNPTTSEEPQVRIQLSNRMILSPFAAKRLAALLNNVVGQYESRFGKLPMPGSEKAAGDGAAS